MSISHLSPYFYCSVLYSDHILMLVLIFQIARWIYIHANVLNIKLSEYSNLLRNINCLSSITSVQHSSRSSSQTSTKLLRQLSWLPVKWQIKFKLASLTFKALHTSHLPYFTNLLQCHKPTRSAHSYAGHLHSVPLHNLSFGSRAFRVSAPENVEFPTFCQSAVSNTLFI